MTHDHARRRESGSATFLRLPELTSALAAIAPDHEVHIHFAGLNYVDHACFDALASWEKQQMARGGRVYLNWSEVEFLAQRPNANKPASPSGAPPAISQASNADPKAEPPDAVPANGASDRSTANQ